MRGAVGTHGAVCLLLEAISSGEGGCRVTRGHFHNSAVRILRGRAARIEQQRAVEAARTLLVLEVSLSFSLSRFLSLFFCLSCRQSSSYPSSTIISLPSASTFSDHPSLLFPIFPFNTYKPPCRYLVPSCNTFLLLLSSLSFFPRFHRLHFSYLLPEFFPSLVSLQLSSVSLCSGYNTASRYMASYWCDTFLPCCLSPF